MITKSKIEELFFYKDGNLYRKNVNHIKRYGEKAGWLCRNGYLYVSIDKKSYLVHRLIWILHFNFPAKFIDHIDNNRSNNHISNLRESTPSQNSCNMKLRESKKIQIKNVYECYGGYEVRFCLNYKKQRFGKFLSIEDAEKFAIEYRKKLHKEFAREK